MVTERFSRGGLAVGSLVLGIALSLVAGGIAHAWWSRTSIVPGPGALSSGTLDLTVGPSSGSEQLAGAGGSWTYSLVALTGAVPTSSQATSLVLRNSGTAPLSVTATVSTADATFSSYVLVDTSTGGTPTNTTSNGLAAGSCSGTAALTGVGVSATPALVLPSTTLTANQTLTLCLVFRLALNAPAALQGRTSGTFTLALSAIQET